MLKSLQAVTTPQSIINDCMQAAEVTGLGRYPLMAPLEATIDHFAFCPLNYTEVSRGLEDMMDYPHAVGLPLDGEAMMGQQKPGNGSLGWYWNNSLASLAAVNSKTIPLWRGGGYVAVRSELESAASWLRNHDVDFKMSQPYGVNALWVPLRTPGWGIGFGYFALCVTAETLLETAHRLLVAE